MPVTGLGGVFLDTEEVTIESAVSWRRPTG